MTKMLFLGCVVLAACSPAFAGKPCEELKSEIAAKLDHNGVANYTLAIVPAGGVGDAKVVGSCDGGTNKITYEKGASAAPPSSGKPANSQPASDAPGAAPK